MTLFYIIVIVFIFYSLISSYKKDVEKKQNQLSDHSKAIIIIISVVMRADGSVVRAELDYVKEFFKEYFNDSAIYAQLYLRDALKQPVNINVACNQINAVNNYQQKLKFIDVLFNIAKAHGEINFNELNTLGYIAESIFISSADFNRITESKAQRKERNYNYQNSENKQYTYSQTSNQPNAYSVLGVSSKVSDNEVKKAYRAAAIRFHPDKAVNLGEKQQKAAEENFKKINNAYEEIKRERGIK